MAAWRRSFVSGEVTPMFDLAAGTIECYDNRWYVAAPVYSLALLDGFGRIGHDRHWFSDVIGSALLGVGTCIVIMLSITGMRIFPAPPPIERQLSIPAKRADGCHGRFGLVNPSGAT